MGADPADLLACAGHADERCVDGEAGNGRPTASALVVLLAGDVLAPAGLGPFVAGDGLDDGRAGHEVVGCGAVPVPFAGRGTDDVADADSLDLAVAWLVEAVAFGDAGGLTDGGTVPCRAGRRGGRSGSGLMPGAGGVRSWRVRPLIPTAAASSRTSSASPRRARACCSKATTSGSLWSR